MLTRGTNRSEQSSGSASYGKRPAAMRIGRLVIDGRAAQAEMFSLAVVVFTHFLA